MIFLTARRSRPPPSCVSEFSARIEGFFEHGWTRQTPTFFVITTRPTGYTERLLPEHNFDQPDLGLLLIPMRRLNTAVSITQTAFHRRVLSMGPRCSPRFESAFGKLPQLNGSLKTPLQVLIFTIILGTSGALAG